MHNAKTRSRHFVRYIGSAETRKAGSREKRHFRSDRKLPVPSNEVTGVSVGIARQVILMRGFGLPGSRAIGAEDLSLNTEIGTHRITERELVVNQKRRTGQCQRRAYGRHDD